MKLIVRHLSENGATVTIPRATLEAFAGKWPCFGRVRRAVTACFDREGDLVDIAGDNGLDGPGMIALLDDVQRELLARCPAWEAHGHSDRLNA